MANTFKLEIVTPERIELSEEVTAVRAPAIDGYIGILANHAPLVTALAVGELRITTEDRCTLMATSGGFMEVSNNVCTILADSCERWDRIDVRRAEEAVERARERLLESQPGIDHARADAALRRAVNRLKVAEEGRDNA
jgi:F-type H+-transporting ATPase subunit epsilon